VLDIVLPGEARAQYASLYSSTVHERVVTPTDGAYSGWSYEAPDDLVFTTPRVDVVRRPAPT
jgi:hypothetical protein